MSVDVGSRVQEVARIRALEALQVLDTPTEERFDRVARLAQRLFQMPSVAVSLLGEDRQWFKSHIGTSLREGPRTEAFCDHAIKQSGPLIVADATKDRRFLANPLVVGPHGIRFYAGQPLEAPGGLRIGTLCMWDTRPRYLDQSDLDLLKDLGTWVEKELASDTELNRAGQVQQGLLPSAAPTIPGYEIAGVCLPANQVGGDFFDYYLVGDELQVCIADVMGKGIPAAIIAAGVRAVLRGASQFNQIGESVNRAAYSLQADLTDTGTFVTLFSARLNPVSGGLSYVDAGHGLSAIVNRSGRVDQLASQAPPVGVLAGFTFAEQHSMLCPGDTLISVSDGWLDFFPTTAEAAEAAVRIVLRCSSAQDIVDEIGTVSAGYPPLDDLTAVVVRRAL